MCDSAVLFMHMMVLRDHYIVSLIVVSGAARPMVGGPPVHRACCLVVEVQRTPSVLAVLWAGNAASGVMGSAASACALLYCSGTAVRCACVHSVRVWCSDARCVACCSHVRICHICRCCSAKYKKVQPAAWRHEHIACWCCAHLVCKCLLKVGHTCSFGSAGVAAAEWHLTCACCRTERQKNRLPVHASLWLWLLRAPGRAC